MNAPDSADEPRSFGELSEFEQEIEQVVWALLDGQLSAREKQRFEEILAGSEEARLVYLNCLQMHGDLVAHFQKPDEQAPSSDRSPTGKTPWIGVSTDDPFPPYGPLADQSESWSNRSEY